MKAYRVIRGSKGIDGLMPVEIEKPLPGPHDVLVRMRAASLNFRDLAVVNGKYIRGPLERDTIPLSDGAGEVEAVGAGVSEFKAGDRVVASFTQGEPPAALGSPLDGTLTEYALFHPRGLLPVPSHLSFAEAATLPCAGVTAWNALTGGKPLRPGATVLTLGTGGVSIFALQLAKLAGARVVITSSSDAKLERAKTLAPTIPSTTAPHPTGRRRCCGSPVAAARITSSRRRRSAHCRTRIRLSPRPGRLPSSVC